VDESRAVLQAGRSAGLQPRLHANQLTESGAVQLAVELDAASADHCTHLADGDIDALAGSNTVATLLPLVEFSTRSPYPPGRKLIDAGATVALATDCNPGSGYSTSMSLAIALAVREMRLTPAEAIRAATVGGAQALRRTDIGRIAVGNKADLVVLDAPSYVHLAYRPGVPLIHQTWISGVRARRTDG
jgi:imidazolonepropionase